MKKSNVKRLLAVLLAFTVAITPIGSVSFADENDAGSNEVKHEEPAKEQPKETPSAPEVKAPAQTEDTSSGGDSTQGQPSEGETDPAVNPEEQAEVEKPRVEKSSYQVKIVLEGVMTTSGPTTITPVSSVTIKAGATKTYSATTMNRWITAKSVKYDGVTYKYENMLKDASGNTHSSITIKADDLYDDTTLVFRPVYQELADMSVTVNFNNIMKTNGEMTSNTVTNVLSAGSGWSFTQKKLDNMVVAKSFNLDGVDYTYAGKWVDEDGNEFTSLSIKNTGEQREVVYNVSPVYNKLYSEVLDFNYIDNISTGSGSWMNKGKFTTFSHTFKQPESQAHYKFVEWKNLDTGDTYQPGQTFKYTAKASQPEQVITEINIHAMWQPSVTVEYYSNGKLVKSVEKLDASIAAYGYNGEDTEEAKAGAKFIGWYESDSEGAAKVAESTEYALPEVTSKAVEPKVVKLYAKYSTSYKVEHYAENLTGGYELMEDETEVVEDAVIGTKVSADAKSFEGFSFNENAEGSKAEGNVNVGLTLKLYYDRNSYEVTYEYVGDVLPKAADEQLPETAVYKYGTDVPAADMPRVKGYKFIGWDGEVDRMPANNVTVTGSWEKVNIPTPIGHITKDDPTPGIHTYTSVFEDNGVPMANTTTTIGDHQTPLAVNGAWALINLLCAIATALLSLVLMIGSLRRREEEENDETYKMKKHVLVRLASVIPAVVAVIAFLITENMANPMVLIDNWTVMMAAILLIQVGVAILAKRTREDETEEYEAVEE